MKSPFIVIILVLCSVFFVSCGNNVVMNDSSINTLDNTISTETPQEPTETPQEPTETPQEPTETPQEPTETPQEPTETSVAKVSEIDKIYGKWKILDMVGEGYVYGDFSMEDYVGGIVAIHENYIESDLPLGKRKLENPKYKLTKKSKDDFWMDRHANLDNGFGFNGKRITLVEVFDGNDEWDEFADHFWIRDENHIIFEGPVYFLAEKVE